LKSGHHTKNHGDVGRADQIYNQKKGEGEDSKVYWRNRESNWEVWFSVPIRNEREWYVYREVTFEGR